MLYTSKPTLLGHMEETTFAIDQGGSPRRELPHTPISRQIFRCDRRFRTDYSPPDCHAPHFHLSRAIGDASEEQMS